MTWATMRVARATTGLWVEESVQLHGFMPPRMTVHSANAAARLRMLAGIQPIERLAQGLR